MKVELGANVLWYEEGVAIGLHLPQDVPGVPKLQPQALTLDGINLEPVKPTDFYVRLANLCRPGYESRAADVVKVVRASVGRRALVARGLTGDMWLHSALEKDGSGHFSVIAGIRVVGFAALQTEIGNKFHWPTLPLPYVTVLEAQQCAGSVIPELWQKAADAPGSLGLYRSDLFTQVFPLNPPQNPAEV